MKLDEECNAVTAYTVNEKLSLPFSHHENMKETMMNNGIANKLHNYFIFIVSTLYNVQCTLYTEQMKKKTTNVIRVDNTCVFVLV